ncbi:MAG: hypothetical protein IH899_05790 [Planctomycetes bacterium]|nr:hypothetical protein [Planctomycetota bacterium]
MLKQTTEISGKWIVIGMFTFAVAIISVLWIYTVSHRAPFRPLERALAEEFEDSAPKVEGGQRKIHENSSKILRIIMKVEFDPSVEREQAERFAERVIAFTRKHQDISRYEVLEIHFFKLEPEKKILQWETERKVADLLEQSQAD